jgi:hypothetical protein
MQEKNVGQNENQNAIFPIQENKRRGRPKKQHTYEEGFDVEVPAGRPRSAAIHRRWQRDMIKPQFHLNRREAFEVFFKYLRSTKGKTALRDIINQGSPGIGKLTDAQLGKYLEQTNLLSRYPHEVVIQG